MNALLEEPQLVGGRPVSHKQRAAKELNSQGT